MLIFIRRHFWAKISREQMIQICYMEKQIEIVNDKLVETNLMRINYILRGKMNIIWRSSNKEFIRGNNNIAAVVKRCCTELP